VAQKHSHSVRRRSAPDFSSIRTPRAISWGADELFLLIYFDRDSHCARFNDRNMKHILAPKSTTSKGNTKVLSASKKFQTCTK